MKDSDDFPYNLNRKNTDHSNKTGMKWHRASRDWLICALTVKFLIIIILFIMFLFSSDIFQNNVMNGFFIIFIGFLIFISGYYLHRRRILRDYIAAFVPMVRNPDLFVESLVNRLSDNAVELNSDKIIGYTFGLLNPVKTLEIANGDIICICETRMVFEFVIGMYILVKAEKDSDLIRMVETLIKTD